MEVFINSQRLAGINISMSGHSDRKSMEQRLITCTEFGFNSWERATSRSFPFCQLPVSPTGFYVVPIEIERNQHDMSRCELKNV